MLVFGSQDDWDASSDDEKKAAPKPTGPAPPVRQKGITKQKIAEKEAAERARLEEIASRVSPTGLGLACSGERSASHPRPTKEPKRS